ncbi:MAG: hypothetical protein GY754_15435 [bacterium]|nr:hypothetical protein [bacterium]
MFFSTKTNKKIIWRILLFSLIFIASPLSLYAQEILFLNNGRVIQGTILERSKDAVVFREKGKTTPERFKPEAVLRVLFNKTGITKKYIYKNNGSVQEGYIILEYNDRIIVRKDLQINKEIEIKRSSILAISHSKIENKKKYTFRYQGKADSVFIEGDFNGWEPEPLIKKLAWEKAVKINILKKNEYEYRYIVDNIPGKKKHIRFKIEEGKLLEDIDKYRVTLAVHTGFTFYNFGYADKFESMPPMISISGRTNLPFIWDRLALQLEAAYVRSAPIKEKNPGIWERQSNVENLAIVINNYIIGGFLVLDFYFFDNFFGIHPRIGSGYSMQVWDISGYYISNGAQYNSTVNNSHPFMGAGCEFSLTFKNFVSICLGFQNRTSIEDGSFTMLNGVTLGVGFRL